MPSKDSAPYNGDYKLWGRESRAYFLYGWGEIKANREPDGVIQARADDIRADDDRSPYRVYADTLMRQIIADYAPQPISIIDIGCGGGKYAALFKDLAGDYHGVDAFDYPSWPQTQKAAQDWPLSVHFHHQPAEKIDALDIQANFSLSSSALEHVDDPDAAIAGLAARTENGAYGLHIVPGPWSLITYGKHGWRRFSAQRLSELFTENGFEVVKLYRLGGLPSSLSHLFWISHLEEGAALQSLTLSALPFILYRAASVFRFPKIRRHRLSAPVYRAILRISLKLDRFMPRMAVGYAILVRRKV